MTHSLASRLAAAALVFGLAVPAFAEDYTADHMAAAKAAIAASHVSDGLDDILIGIAQQTKALLVRTNPAQSDAIDKLVNAAALELASKRPELDKQIQEVWAARFTKEELQKIAEFYNSPVGQKLSKETAGMVQMSGIAAQVWQHKIGGEMLAKVREAAKAKGIAL
ncbi:MAG: DUF2059 domain-containing protein [Hyphomicrobiales bacterium]|nr:DUF2059 domain-containing protein [Hyphomicrobiales bacterium]